MCELNLAAGPEAALPGKRAVISDIEATEEEDPVPVVPVITVVQPKSPQKAKRKLGARITHNDVLREQYKALIAKQETLKLKKRKLQLEVFLLERRMQRAADNTQRNATFATINLSPIQWSFDSPFSSPKQK